MRTNTKFRWLHLSDIHVGMSDQDRLWPTLKHALFDDLARLLDKTGPADLLVFSGDLTQKGAVGEFTRFNDVLAEINERLSALARVPSFVAAPGNHDLERPRQGGPLEAAMRQIPGDPAILRQMWETGGDYPTMMARVFEPFTSWQDELIERGLHLKPVSRGPLPGDMALEVPFDGGTASIVVLNSTWLQLTGEDYRGRLYVDPLQINGATGGDPVAWCRGHAVNLLVTHQPTSWLHSAGLECWNSEIFPPGRFDVHLFGHMHEHDARSTTRGGSAARREIQGASIFGLEFADGRVARSHGYSFAQIDTQGEQRTLTVWPRTLRTMAGGERKLVADQLQELSEDNNFSWILPGGSTATTARAAPPPPTVSLDDASRPDAKSIVRIESTRYHLAVARAHGAVRRVERDDASAAISAGGSLWIACDWGLGEDGFLWSLLEARAERDVPIYRLTLEHYRSRDELLSGLHAVLGCEFQQFCEYLSRLPAAVLLLDNLPTLIQLQPGERAIERDLEDVAAIVREYAPSTSVILRGRPRPQQVQLPLVALSPFDDADVADYVRAHELGGEGLVKPETVTTIWRYTGGSPARIDIMLRDLQLTSLSELVSADDGRGEEPSGAIVPTTLVGALAELTRSNTPLLERAYQLLEALTALPRGEQLDRMKRFLGPHPIFYNHAHELESRGLIEFAQMSGLAAEDPATSAKTLIVRRVVLEYVRAQMSPERRREIENRALDLYFGDKWRTGDVAHSPAGKRCANPLCEPHEIINACALVQKLVVRSRDGDEGVSVEVAVSLASSFIEVLITGDHFDSASQLARQVIEMVPPAGQEKRIDVLRYALGRAVRMCGRPDDAREIFQSIDRNNLSKSQRRQLDLGLALIFERLGDEVQAAKFVREVHKGGRNDGIGIQAQAILAEQIVEPRERAAQLGELERRARRRDATVAANNIALSRAALDEDGTRADHLDRVVKSAETDRDFYNGARAIIKMVGKARTGPVPADQLARLINAYQHLYNERGARLFDECHKTLWSVFADNRDFPNLLRLFRQSSLIWRLRGEADREGRYLAELTQHAVSAITSGPTLGRELSYYRARVAAALERKGVD